MRNITNFRRGEDFGDLLSKLLKKYRELATVRLTQEELATRLGVSTRSIRDWETGINLPAARNLKKIIEVYYLLGLFTPGKEREEAQELWTLRQGKDSSNTFPLFDTAWLESVTSLNKQEAIKVDKLTSPRTTTSVPQRSEKVILGHSIPNNLSLPLTSFIGREKELEAITRLLSNTRLLTLTGIGGAGKTRLAQEVAQSLQETALANYPDGIWWVELMPLTDPRQVIHAIISALMVEKRQEGDYYELLQTFLQSKNLLLVLDNCEHLVVAVATLVRKLLKDCPLLQILTTSRESLNLTGEQVWPLEGLSVPKTKKPQTWTEVLELETSATIRLFVERARSVQPLFVLNAENTPAVLEICRQLDGLPLAIELAAARVKGLGVEQISRRLQQNLKFLSDKNATHQTVQAMIEWSYNLLAAEEQLLLRRMAVFRGDFSLEAAEGILSGEAGPGSERLDPDDVLMLLLQLVNKSLVIAVHLENNTETRYRLLEMIRQSLQEKLEANGEAAYLSYKHLAFYTDFVEKGYHNYFDHSARWVDQLEQEIANLRAALTWALAYSQNQNQHQHQHQGQSIMEKAPGELALRLSTGLGRFWYLKNSVREGQYWLKAALALDGLAEREDLKAVLAKTYFSLGANSFNRDDQPVHYLNLSLRLFEELGDKWFIVAALTNLGRVYSTKGSYAEAKALLLRSLTLVQEIEDQFYLGYILSHLGLVAMYQGDTDDAMILLQKSEAVHRSHNDQYALAYNLLYLGQISRQKQDLPQALNKIEESLQLFRIFSNKQGIADSLNVLSIIQLKVQNYQQARLLAEEAVAICEELGDTNTLGYVYNNLAEINIKEGKTVEARNFARQSLVIRRKSDDNKGIMESLHTFALLVGSQGQWEEYAWLYAAADTMRQQLGISQDYMNEQTEFDRLNEEAGLYLVPANLDRLRVKGQTDRLDDIFNQLLATK